MTKRTSRRPNSDSATLAAVTRLTLAPSDERRLDAEQQVFEAGKLVARLAMALAPTVEPAVEELDRGDDSAVAIIRAAHRIVVGRDP